MLRWVVFASAVWSHVSLCVSDPVGAFIRMHVAAVGCSRAHGKSILYAQHVHSGSVDVRVDDVSKHLERSWLVSEQFALRRGS